MKKTNFLAIVLIGLSMLLSCDRNSQADSAASMQDSLNALMHDSLSTALAEKDSLMALMNEISEGMNQIKDMEQIVSSQDLNAETPDRKAQLRNDMMLIQKGIADRKRDIHGDIIFFFGMGKHIAAEFILYHIEEKLGAAKRDNFLLAAEQVEGGLRAEGKFFFKYLICFLAFLLFIQNLDIRHSVYPIGLFFILTVFMFSIIIEKR